MQRTSFAKILLCVIRYGERPRMQMLAEYKNRPAESSVGQFFLRLQMPQLQLLLVGPFNDLFPVAEQKGNSPNPRQSNQGINDPADRRRLPAKHPGHNVKLEQADAAPVQRADDHQDQGYLV